METVQAYRRIGDRYLPGTHHLVSRDQTAYRAIANRDQEGFAANSRKTQDAEQVILQRGLSG